VGCGEALTHEGVRQDSSRVWPFILKVGKNPKSIFEILKKTRPKKQ
jgi:hypothetical protein